jgi:hypothetical protein
MRIIHSSACHLAAAGSGTSRAHMIESQTKCESTLDFEEDRKKVSNVMKELAVTSNKYIYYHEDINTSSFQLG